MDNLYELAVLQHENEQLNIMMAEISEENNALKLEVDRLNVLVQRYLEMLNAANRKIFGASSEQTPDQLGLFNEAEVVASETPEPESETITYTRKKSVGKREDFYKNIPTVQKIHELPEDQRICPDCGGPLHVCGSEVLRKEVEIIPAQLRAVEHVQNVYSCRHCEQHSDADSLPMIKSSVPVPVISGSGIASPSLVAYVASCKYVLATPIARLEDEFNRLGVIISRQNMSNWMIYVSIRWLSPIFDLMHCDFLLNNYIHADETTIQVINELDRNATTKSFMWVYVTGRFAEHQIVLFVYSETRASHNPLDFLEGYTGRLTTDGYAGYNKLTVQGVIPGGCFSHARRYFEKALKVMPKAEQKDSLQHKGLDFCNKLFELERKFSDLTPEERLEQRLLYSKPVCDDFFEWAENTLPLVQDGSKLRTALVYVINQREKLCQFLSDGHVEIHNNRAENCIRPFAVGRKNWLFAYSPKGANASAIIYSIVQTAEANGLVPYKYLNFLFETMPNIPEERYAECLPWGSLAQELCGLPE
jgi:transposase